MLDLAVNGLLLLSLWSAPLDRTFVKAFRTMRLEIFVHQSQGSLCDTNPYGASFLLPNY